MSILTALRPLAQLFFPPICLSCQRQLSPSEPMICIICHAKLDTTQFHEHSHDNTLVRRFWGRLHLEHAMAYWFYRKKSPVRPIIHAFKYHSRPQVATHFTKEYAERYLNKSKMMADIDCIVPIPIHSSRQRKRGYNQSAVIAEALSQHFQIPWSDNWVKRTVATDTQTKKSSSFERWDNVQTIFEIPKPELLNNKHILLVDDVITTGSTIESCGVSIREATKGTRFSILGLACRL
ncbi:MAG: ComF family protein [Chitinophagales bacterium]|nr:ComF family protein [Chitinophagales bacterium]